MADIHEIHNLSGASIRLLRKLEKLGFLRVTAAKNPELSKMLSKLKKSEHLTVYQIVLLYNDADRLATLGNKEWIAQDQIDNLGDIAGEKAPMEVAMVVQAAAARDKEAVTLIASWLRSCIDHLPQYAGEGVPYVHVGVRLLAGSMPVSLERNAALLPTAMLQVRKHKLMDGYSTLIGGKSFFHRKNNFLDL